MFDVHITKHAEKRMQQRGISVSDIDIILEHGKAIDGNGIFLTSKRSEQIIRSLKKKIAAVERLRNTKVVVKDDRVVSCYPCRNSEIRRMKKRTRQH